MKKFLSRSIQISVQDPVYEEPLKAFKADFKDPCKNAREEIDPAFPEPKRKPIVTSIFFDSDHVHDTKTRWSLLGTLVVIGSTYSSEFLNEQDARYSCIFDV